MIVANKFDLQRVALVRGEPSDKQRWHTKARACSSSVSCGVSTGGGSEVAPSEGLNEMGRCVVDHTGTFRSCASVGPAGTTCFKGLQQFAALRHINVWRTRSPVRTGPWSRHKLVRCHYFRPPFLFGYECCRLRAVGE